MKKIKLFLKIRKCKGGIASFAILVLPGLVGCGKSGEYSFDKPEDAIECYQSFHSKLKELKSSNTSDFGNMLKKWREVNDTVKKFLAKDSVLVKDMVVAGKYLAMKDSVKNQMIRLTETWRYNYNDVMQIKEQTSPFIDDETLLAAVREYEPFFSSLNTVQVKPSNKNKVLKQYRDFLHEAKIQGFSNKDDLLKFIRHEDYCFRSFLLHLHEMGNDSLSDITYMTEDVCAKIFLAASVRKIKARDAIAIMSMRTARRLLQNSLRCIDNINHLPMQNSLQRNAYLWMIIQPYISIDNLTIASLTEAEKSNLREISSQLSKSKNFAKAFDIELQSLNYLLPQQFLKLYILSF